MNPKARKMMGMLVALAMLAVALPAMAGWPWWRPVHQEGDPLDGDGQSAITNFTSFHLTGGSLVTGATWTNTLARIAALEAWRAAGVSTTITVDATAVATNVFRTSGGIVTNVVVTGP